MHISAQELALLAPIKAHPSCCGLAGLARPCPHFMAFLDYWPSSWHSSSFLDKCSPHCFWAPKDPPDCNTPIDNTSDLLTLMSLHQGLISHQYFRAASLTSAQLRPLPLDSILPLQHGVSSAPSPRLLWTQPFCLPLVQLSTIQTTGANCSLSP